jgi:hypothetical protein
MRRHLKDTIECQVLIDEVKKVTPIPGEVFDNPMRVEFNPQIEAYERDTERPSACPDDDILAFRSMAADNSEEAVGDEIAHEYQVNNSAEHQPGIVLDGSFRKSIVFVDFGLQFMLEKVVEPWARLVPGFGTLEELPSSGPDDQLPTMRLNVEKNPNSDVV